MTFVRAVAFGVGMEVSSDRPADVQAALPPSARPGYAPDPIRVHVGADNTVTVLGACVDHPAAPVSSHPTMDSALDAVTDVLAMQVGLTAPDFVFVHAGVVGVPGGALVLPGTSYAGKSTLVAALVDLGCPYFSDEFAVVDRAGRVHPYARPLRLRTDAGPVVQVLEAADGPVPVAATACLTYRQGRHDFHVTTPAQAAMGIIANALAARSRPREALRAARLLAAGVTVGGTRGEAGDAAESLLALVADGPSYSEPCGSTAEGHVQPHCSR